jgi:Family of unknown function (DUF6226)
MPEYTRPTIKTREFRDEFGAVIRYGTRWTGPPPDDSYSRVRNPERFAPLQTIADALIDHLRATYRAKITPSTTSAGTKLVAVTPEHADAAPLVFRFTDFPGVKIGAGVRYNAAFPACGCDACDETWDDGADDMERLVFAATAGRFSERVNLPGDQNATVEYRIETLSGAGRSGVTHVVEPDPGLRVDAARSAGRALAAVDPHIENPVTRPGFVARAGGPSLLRSIPFRSGRSRARAA